MQNVVESAEKFLLRVEPFEQDCGVMAHDVFISYASGDKQVADAVCATLESHGIRCWIAPRDVIPGIHYGEAIIDAIHDCRIMVLVFSAKANLSGHIPKEIERAVSQGSTVMPLRIEDVLPAKSLDYFIGSVHWLDALTPPLEAHLQRLAANIQTLLSRSGAHGEPQPVPAAAPAAPRRSESAIRPAPPELRELRAAAHSPAKPTWAYSLIAVLTLIVLAMGFWTYRSRFQSSAPPASAPAVNSAKVAVALPVAAPENPKKLVAPVSASSAPEPHTPAASATTPPASHSATAAPLAETHELSRAASPASTPSREVTLKYVSDSTAKLEQLIGDLDKERQKPTGNQTLTRFGIEGTELGYSFEHDGHAYFLFGPSVGRLPQEPDTIAKSDTANPEGGVHLDFLTNGADAVAVQPADATMTLLDVPVAGISLGGQMYVAVSTNVTRGRTTDRTVLTKFVPPATFQTIRTVSQLPGGRFIRMSLHAQPGPVAGLPDGGPYILAWGTGQYRESDAYLSIVPAAQFESGKGTRYFSGMDAANRPTWSDSESDAVPIVKDGTLADVSVTWCKDLNLWLMTYDRRTQLNGIAFSYSRIPWGPWSEPQILFNAARDNGLGKFIHNPARRVDDGLAGPTMGARKRESPEDVHGAAFAPYVIERWTKVQNSELSLYYVMSTGNPYVVVLMKSRIQIE